MEARRSISAIPEPDARGMAEDGLARLWPVLVVGIDDQRSTSMAADDEHVGLEKTQVNQVE